MINIYSFSAYNSNVPKDIKTFDCRDLNDPYSKGIGNSGLDKRCQEYVLADPKALPKLETAYNHVIETRQDVGFYCLAGRFRSVALACALHHKLLQDPNIPSNELNLVHIDLQRWDKLWGV